MVKQLRRNQSGQSTVEYILLLGIVSSLFVIAMKGMRGLNLPNLITKPLQTDFAHAYQYGHPKAKGFGEDGGPSYHPRFDTGGSENNFRIFMSPGRK